MQANMNCSRVVTIMMLPMVRMATNTHWTTCWGRGKGRVPHWKTTDFQKLSLHESRAVLTNTGQSGHTSSPESTTRWKSFACVLTLSPLALLMALRGLSTRRTRRIFTTEMAEDLLVRERQGRQGLSPQTVPLKTQPMCSRLSLKQLIYIYIRNSWKMYLKLQQMQRLDIHVECLYAFGKGISSPFCSLIIYIYI